MPRPRDHRGRSGFAQPGPQPGGDGDENETRHSCRWRMTRRHDPNDRLRRHFAVRCRHPAGRAGPAGRAAAGQGGPGGVLHAGDRLYRRHLLSWLHAGVLARSPPHCARWARARVRGDDRRSLGQPSAAWPVGQRVVVGGAAHVVRILFRSAVYGHRKLAERAVDQREPRYGLFHLHLHQHDRAGRRTANPAAR